MRTVKTVIRLGVFVVKHSNQIKETNRKILIRLCWWESLPESVPFGVTCFLFFISCIQVLYEGLTADVESVEGRSSRISPFSARAAFQQTQHILRSTKDTTKAVLSTVTDTSWWQGAIHKLKQPTKRQISLDYTERNKKMELQSCHPFYDGIIQNCYSNVVSFRLMFIICIRIKLRIEIFLV